MLLFVLLEAKKSMRIAGLLTGTIHNNKNKHFYACLMPPFANILIQNGLFGKQKRSLPRYLCIRGKKRYS